MRARSEPRIRVLSLGAGVQSTTLALMAAAGEIGPMPDCAIFADTGWEPKAVYETMERLRVTLPYPVLVVSSGDIRTDVLTQVEGNPVKLTGRAPSLPFFSRGADGKAAPIRRQCTSHYKIEPIERKLRDMLGLKPRQRAPKLPAVELWIGISRDEIYRMKPAQQPWITRRWPLIKERMDRNDCLRWLERHGYPAPEKSSCIGCPYHSDAHWRRMRDIAPEEFAEAVELDDAIRSGLRRNDKGTRTGALYLHRSLTPLRDLAFATPAELGQGDLFAEECEGACGL